MKIENKILPYFYIGDRGEKDFWKFYYILPGANEFYSDAYKVYSKVSRYLKNFTVKKEKYREINLNESLHANIALI